MTWFGELRRRLSALFGWLRRPGQGTTAMRSLPATPAVKASISSESAGASGAVSAGPVASPSAAPSAVAPAVALAVVPAVVPAVAASVAAVPLAAVPQAAPPAAPSVAPPAVTRRASPPQPVGPTMDPQLGQLKARQFFARMIAATPAGLTIDFSDWRSASVERFFLAMTSPGLTRRREAPTSGVEQVSLTNAFQGFEWD